MNCPFSALEPITASVLISDLLKGNTPSFLRRTIESAATCLINSLSSFKSFDSSGFSSGFFRRPVNSATLRILVTLSLIVASLTLLSFTAFTRFSPQVFAGPGISQSNPPLAFSIVCKAAPQSLTT